MKATKVKMISGFENSNETPEIARIDIEDCDTRGLYTPAELYDIVKEKPGSVCVDIPPYPKLVPIKSKMHGNFVRAAKNRFEKDKLMDLPRVVDED